MFFEEAIRYVAKHSILRDEPVAPGYHFKYTTEQVLRLVTDRDALRVTTWEDLPCFFLSNYLYTLHRIAFIVTGSLQSLALLNDLPKKNTYDSKMIERARK